MRQTTSIASKKIRQKIRRDSEPTPMARHLQRLRQSRIPTLRSLIANASIVKATALMQQLAADPPTSSQSPWCRPDAFLRVEAAEASASKTASPAPSSARRQTRAPTAIIPQYARCTRRSSSQASRHASLCRTSNLRRRPTAAALLDGSMSGTLEIVDSIQTNSPKQ
jgi:hypothetical protein